MKLLKILIVLFLIYIIRRFMQFYRAMKQLQENQLKAQETKKQAATDDVVSAEFKILKDV